MAEGVEACADPQGLSKDITLKSVVTDAMKWLIVVRSHEEAAVTQSMVDPVATIVLMADVTCDVVDEWFNLKGERQTKGMLDE